VVIIYNLKTYPSWGLGKENIIKVNYFNTKIIFIEAKSMLFYEY